MDTDSEEHRQSALTTKGGDMPGVSAFQQYVDDCVAALHGIDLDAVAALAQAILEVRAAGRTVFTAGNGGSATTATHMATDLMFTTRLANPPLHVIALTDNVATMTATANDLSYGEVFSRQLSNLGSAGDLLVLVSASGNSPNMISAAATAKDLGIRTAALTGFGGGQLAKTADISVHLATPKGAYGPVEDVHLSVNHMITRYLQDCS